ncbi:MAG: hypothetical protein HYZ93_02475 [Candidatus Omnitrophica bacterium]|nr:hypothetical protein [Candidatus Omnitrophota bacterium]
MTTSLGLETVLLLAGGATLLSLLLTPAIRAFAVLTGAVSRPSQDRWGRRAIARLGGLSIAVGFLITVAWGISRDHRMLGLFLGGLLMLFVGLVDDFRRIPPYTKLVAQIIAGCLVVLCEIQVQTVSPWLAIPLTITWLVLIMNAFNLLDNMDGLSAGVGVIAALFCIWHAVQNNQWLVAALSASLGGATLGFLRYNLPPAKIFMGDSGSQLLGLGLGTLSLMGNLNQSTRLLGILALPTLLLAVPIFDTCFVTVQRILHGRHPFQGGTDHLSHRLGILGLSTRQVVFALYGLSATFGWLSLLLSSQGPIAVTGVWLLVVVLLLLLGVYLSRVRVYAGAEVPAPPLNPQVTFISTMLLYKQRILEVCVDFALICASYVIAFALRFEGNITYDLEVLIMKSLPWIIVAKMVSFFACGVYRGVRRYTSLADAVNIFRGVVLGSVFSSLAPLYLWRFEGYSRAVFIIDGLLLFVTVGASRVAERLLNEWITGSVEGAVPVLIVGAGDTGELLLRQIKQEAQGKRRVIGFLDDDPAKQGDRIHGIRIRGSRKELGVVVQEFSVREIFIAMRYPPEELLRQVRGYCEENGISWRVVKTVAANESPLVPDR